MDTSTHGYAHEQVEWARAILESEGYTVERTFVPPTDSHVASCPACLGAAMNRTKVVSELKAGGYRVVMLSGPYDDGNFCVEEEL